MNVLIEFFLKHLVMIISFSALFAALYRVQGRWSHQEKAGEILKKSLATSLHEPLSLHPEIDPNLCSGCGACTTACPEGDILKMVNHKAMLVHPSKCVGHGECEKACPMSAIKLVFGTKTKGADIPRLSTNYETNIPGIYIAGELGGMGLIRNAVKQGAIAGYHAVTQLSHEKTNYDVVIIGGGPAGLAAGLAVQHKNRSYLIIEQNKFGGTIANFPRQKLVMSQPIRLPMMGVKEFPSNAASKKDIMSYWTWVRQQTKLHIREQTKFETVERKGNIFSVKTNAGEFTAKKVILAMGVRGTARKLGVPGEELSKVTYDLIEPEQYQNRQVIVVGGGNAAVESALLLGDPRLRNKVYLLVRSTQLDRANEQNTARLQAAAAARQVEVWFDTQVQKVEEKSVTVDKAKQSVTLPNDFVFIFAGAEMPRQFLMSLGIKIDKKFGEGLVS